MNFYNIKSGFNILPMLKEVSENYKDFEAITTRTNIPCQRETKTIYLIRDTGLHEYEDSKQYKNYHQCRKFMNWFTREYSGEIMRSAIVLLPTNSSVYPHWDGEPFKKDKDRFHMVLSGYYDYTIHYSNPNNEKGIEGSFEGWGAPEETVKFCAGDLWWFANKKVHSARNTSPLPRIAMIFDVFNSDWRNRVKKQ